MSGDRGQSPAVIQELSWELTREAMKLTEKAVRDWSRLVGVTPEEWLKFYEPSVQLHSGEDGKLTVQVTAKRREAEQ